MVVLAQPPSRKASRTRFPRQTPDKTIQDIVTWDQYSLIVNGKRLAIYGGEVHPYRMPVHSLYLDVLQKMKSAGFNAVSIYVFWGIVEPKRGEVAFEGIRDLQPFFDAAKEAGLYLIARPGPYINAETSGGGFPGWGTYTPGLWRTSNTSYVEAYQNYMKTVGSLVAKNEITKGGPVILFQAENEYTGWQEPYTEDFAYEQRLMEDIRASGVTVPITTNDAYPGGHFTSVDIYGYDSYPNGFNCFEPYTWAAEAVPEWFWNAHMEFSPDVPNSVFEFQGGAIDGWGGAGFDRCAILTGPEFERVFYKNQLAMSTTLFNIYMTYGGTNWGGIGYPGVYSSYDYGAAIAEDRTLREKYYEIKLQANFIHASPAYLTTRPMNIYASQGSFTGNSALKVTQVLDVVGNKTGFYVVRQTDASTNAVQNYQLTVPTSLGGIKIPQIGGLLTLSGKDSKIHVVDYYAGTTHLLYSSAEIFTWATMDEKDILIVYGNSGELHETAFAFNTTTLPKINIAFGSGKVESKVILNNTLVLQYRTVGQTVIQVGEKILLYLLDRENAYQFWTLYPPSSGALPRFSTENPVLIKGGYLMRTVSVDEGTLAITGDLNVTSSLEIIAPRASTKAITFNGKKLAVESSAYGTLLAKITVQLPEVKIPNLQSLQWKTADSLPEVQRTYSDTLWTTADRTQTVNPNQPNGTDVVLYAGEYGYHTGNILWRAHFNATGSESGFKVDVWGGTAFGYSIWLDDRFLGSWVGDASHGNYDQAFAFPQPLRKGSTHVLTILQDHMGYNENWAAAGEDFKTPRGIRSYSFIGSNSTSVSVWKVTGNLGGEDHIDRTRGPLNEGGLFAERQGWHLPDFDDSQWASGRPSEGLPRAGVSFYRTNFELNIPKGIDYPLALVVSNSTIDSHHRVQFYVNGYQFGKYVNHLGPQTSFPIPQGIFNYQGPNTLAVSLWALDSSGAKLSFDLKLKAKIESGMAPVVNAPLTRWAPRKGAY
ncbi:glycoside hydrolase family 35 protein [Moniliophthora roreri MCA 2997]|uniref:Beta-galactosidase n=1 Tax=Moniliophthora roreri (strain MCA 2997) TaxID=1381753 RepID=V2X3D6_MONRO|nr:glycoside hydrolase family 35 protein [Moniliophthora roreri MCA 2997]